MDPLIVTLGLDPDLHARLTALREAHFPPERNYLDAHLTLFHALPGNRIEEISATLSDAAAREAARPARIIGLMDLGGGIAFQVEVAGLAALHEKLQKSFAGWLTRQDQQGLRPHVTVQNKVSRARARETLATLRAGFAEFEGLATGLQLWHYRGGPWAHAADFPFEGEI